MIFSAALCLPGEFLLWDNEQATDRLVIWVHSILGPTQSVEQPLDQSRESRKFIASLPSGYVKIAIENGHRK